MFKDNTRDIIYKEAGSQDQVMFEEPGEEEVVTFLELEGGSSEGDDSDYTVFEEDLKKPELDMTLGEALEPFSEGEGSFGDIAEDLKELDKSIESIRGDKDLKDLRVSDLIPGSEKALSDFDDKEDSEKETDYANDGDLSKFMDHVNSLYPSMIPKHDGTSTVGCERAISFLDRLNGDISRAIREDHENILDISALEETRVSIMRDVLVLKNHLSKLKKQIKDSHDKKASKATSSGKSIVPDWKSPSGNIINYSDLKKTRDIEKKASTPNNIVIAVSPFERAISGMMINAHISSGHPMEEVYASLKEKYGLTDREELSIMQLCMDSGFHIFKDRGAYSYEGGSDEGEKRGIDFVRNYFA